MQSVKSRIWGLIANIFVIDWGLTIWKDILDSTLSHRNYDIAAKKSNSVLGYIKRDISVKDRAVLMNDSILVHRMFSISI